MLGMRVRWKEEGVRWLLTRVFAVGILNCHLPDDAPFAIVAAIVDAVGNTGLCEALA